MMLHQINMVKNPFSQSELKTEHTQSQETCIKEKVLFFSLVRPKGSMVLEAGLVLPLFLFFMMTLLLGLEMVRAQADVLEALHQAGNKSAFTGYQVKYEGGDKLSPQQEITEYLKEQENSLLCIKNGSEGLMIQDFSTIEENGVISIKAGYQMKPFVSWLPIGRLHFEDEIYSHAWVGFCKDELLEGEQTTRLYVYVTETGTRYHLSEQCTYLRVQVKTVRYEELTTLRNFSGGKYYPCEKCDAKKGGIVFITEEGNRYHSNSACSSLKRTVYMIPLEEAAGYTPCSKCAG